MRWIVVVSWISLLLACAGTGRRGSNSDATWRVEPARPATHDSWTRSSRYLTMRDGIELAIDIYLPAGLQPGERVPTILRQTRYWRRTRVRWPLAPLMDKPVPLAQYFLRRGYAWVDVDTRGSGASGGWRPHPWSREEVADGAELVDWILAQSWSNQRVGSMGESYDGTASEMLLINQHPAVRAIAPRFALFDVYTDIAMPGGVHLTWFTETWGRANRALDSNELEVIAGPWLSRLVVGASEVDGDGSRSQLEANANSHRWNYDVHRGAQEIVFRDDPARSQGGFTTDTFSPHAHIEATRAAGAAVYSYSGWLDGAYPNAAIKRHRSLARPGDRLLLGPWNHGGDQSIEPRRVSRKRAFDHAGELLRFFDRHVRDGNPLPDDELPVTYYTMVEGRWKHAASWPPPSAPLRLYLAPDQALVEVRPGRDGFDAYQVDPTAGTGDAARWNSLMGDNGPIEYPRRAERDARLLVYDTAPLEQAVEVTGHGLVQLYVRLHAPDANVFAYLEDVAPDASVTYVTEGQLRALHRKRRPVEEASYATPLPWWRSFERADAQPVDPDAVTELVFELLPTSYLFEPGHRIRLAIAGADIDHFPAFPGASPTWEVQRGERWPSHVELPVIRR